MKNKTKLFLLVATVIKWCHVANGQLFESFSGLLRCRTITLGGRYTSNHETIPLKYPDSYLDNYLCAMFGYTLHFSFPLCYSIGLQFWKQKTSRKQNWLAKTKLFFLRTEIFYLSLKIDSAFYWYFRLLKRAKVAKLLGSLRNDDGDGYENIT